MYNFQKRETGIINYYKHFAWVYSSWIHAQTKGKMAEKDTQFSDLSENSFQ